MMTEPDLARAMETCFVHCRPRGAALFVPDCVRGTFVSRTYHGGHDGADRGLRYLEWVRDPDPADTTFVVDFAYLLREADSIRVERDRYVHGLFRRDDWPRLLGAAGFAPRRLADPWSRDIFLGRRGGP